MVIRTPLQRRTFLLASGAIALVGCESASQDPSSELRVGIASAPDSLNPAQGQFAAAALLFKQLYTPLTNYGADGGLAPGIAESWHLSEDGLHWTFSLRENLQWSDGAPITAHDVVSTVQQMLDPNSLYADAGDFFLLSNAEAVLNGTKPIDQIGVHAIDTHTVKFSFVQPLGVFAELMREFYPAPGHILDNPESKWPLPPDFVGSGPYLLTKATQQEIALVRNPLAPDPPHIGNVYVSVVEEAATRTRMVRAGDLDLVEDPPANQITDLKARDGIALSGWDAPRLVYLKINHQHSILSDQRVRRALNLAVDHSFIADQLFEDAAQAAYGILPWAAPGLTKYSHRVETAKELLAKAGLADGFQISMLHSGGLRERIGVVLAENWKQIGVTCNLQGTDGQGLYAFIEAGEFDLAMASFDRGLKRENWRLIEPFASNGFAANLNWTNAAYDAAVASARAEGDALQRDWFAAEAADLLHDDAAIIPLVFERKFWLSSPNIGGFSDQVPPDQWRFLNWK